MWQYNPEIIDPYNVMELQKTEEGLAMMLERHLIDSPTYSKLKAVLQASR